MHLDKDKVRRRRFNTVLGFPCALKILLETLEANIRRSSLAMCRKCRHMRQNMVEYVCVPTKIYIRISTGHSKAMVSRDGPYQVMAWT